MHRACRCDREYHAAVKVKIRDIIRRGGATPAKELAAQVNAVLAGWVNYYRVAIKYHDILLLPVAVKTPHTLNQSHRVPRQIEIDHDVAATLKVDAFAAGFRR